jgi:competence protein ComGC
MLNSKWQSFKHGFTLIEVMVFLFIFTVTVLTFYQTMTDGVLAMATSKAKVGAVKLANEQMEMIRNIDYDKIALAPAGPIENVTQVARSGKDYKIITTIELVDDPFDGESGTGDGKWQDYKKVKVKVFWDPTNEEKFVQVSSLFVPPGIETVHAGGILIIKVIDYSGQPISNAEVNVTNSDTGISFTDYTDSEGKIMLSGYAGSIQHYKAVVNKTGYYTVQSYEPYPVSSFLPDEVHGSIIEGNYNEMSLMTDRLIDFKIDTKDMAGNNVPNVQFELKGGKRKGVDKVTNAPLYEYVSPLLSTGGSAEKSFVDMSMGDYFFTFKEPVTDYEFVRMEPSINTANNQMKFFSSGATATAVLASKNINSLLLTVKDNVTGLPINNEQINLKNALGYDETVTTDYFGQAYFSSVGPLEKTDYSLTINVTGYQSYTENISLTTDLLTKKEVKIIPN